MGKKPVHLSVRVPAITLTCPIAAMLFVDHVYKAVLWLQERLLSYGMHTKQILNLLTSLILSDTAAALCGHCA